MSDTKTTCINPATGEVIAEYPVTTMQELQKAVAKAREVQPAWAATPLRRRIKHILKIRDFIVDHIDELAETLSKDNGKTRMDAMICEGTPVVTAVTYYCKMAPEFLKDKKIKPSHFVTRNKQSFMTQLPFGVIGIIAPWNYPIAIPFSEIVPALLAGNTVIFKGASETQVAGHLLKRFIEAAELPDNVFNYINMPGSVAGDAFLEAGIDKLFLTGSVPIGKYIMEKAAETLTPVSLELGGKDPMIVCEDADLHRAATGAVWAGMQNTGQSCGGVERIYVHKNIYKEFLAILKREVEALRIGPDIDFNTDIGAMVTERQIKTINDHIRDALKKGATILAKSDPPDKLTRNFIPAIVLANVNHNMLVMREETFGPVVGVMSFDTYAEAIQLANDSQLGLSASVWSRDHKKAIEVARKIQSGATTINDHLVSHGMAEAPWGGFKESGIGRTHGALGFAEMVQPKIIMNDTMPFVRKNFWWYPAGKSVYEGARGILYFLYGKGISQRLQGLSAFMKVFPRTFVANK